MIQNSKFRRLRVAAALSSMGFLLSMLPIWYLCFFAAPTGDDYGYGVLTRGAWVDTHSVWEVLKAAVETSRNFFYSWNGDWFTVFLFSLMPDVFMPGTYWVACLLMTVLFIGATTLLLYELCVKNWGMNKEYFIILTAIILFLCYQFVPSMKFLVYWWTGAVHYIFPHAVWMIGCVWMIRFLKTGKIGILIPLILCSVAIGGSSYQSSLLWFLGIVFAVVFGFRRNKKVFWLMIPLLIWGIAFWFQCTAPGIKVRAGSDFGLKSASVVETIILSIWQSLVLFVDWIQSKTLVCFGLGMVGLVGWKALKSAKKGFQFPLPIAVWILLAGGYSALFAPAIYSAVEVSSGPITIEYLYAVLALAVGILYTEGWIQRCLGKKAETEEKETKNKKGIEKIDKIILCYGIALCLIVVWQRSEVKTSTDWQIYEYVSSGQAADFKEQIASQMEILLDDSIKEAYLCPVNDIQGPLMHMPVTDDPDRFTNWVTKNYYRKELVIMTEN